MDVHKKSRGSCDPCRKRKIKCSGDRPTCSHCGRLGLQCIYSQTKRIGRPRRLINGTETNSTSPPQSSGNPAEVSPIAATASSASEPSVVTQQCPDVPFRSTRPSGASPTSSTPAFATFSGDGPFPTSHDAVGPSGTQALNWPHWFDIPCMLQHQPPVNESPGAVLDIPMRTDAKECGCVQAISEYFTSTEDTSAGLGRFKRLREAMDLADRVLVCRICFNLRREEASVSKNILLLGALMSDIAMSYGHLTNRLREETLQPTLQPTHGSVTVGIFVARQDSPESSIAMSVDGKSYWELLRGALVGDLARLSDMGAAFETRQLRAHELGHEDCVAGLPCAAHRVGIPSAISRYVATCPRAVDPKKTFSCFRTVHQVFSSIREAQNVLDA